VQYAGFVHVVYFVQCPAEPLAQIANQQFVRLAAVTMKVGSDGG